MENKKKWMKPEIKKVFVDTGKTFSKKENTGKSLSPTPITS
ncbi:hypothetical protein DFQ04_1214 [Algoriphagus boseongensis]|uniref:Uncharacterized protein n=1 Tax=Algoriphagus boseongensis TaxID=1442587 RepID=A0A4R6TAY9_9BACT|nr:hypothetical protein DFQ04_1214 [Algoriphagus boseongensis]